MAVSAATRDPRFYPMKPADLADFSLEISVLSPLHQIQSVEEIKVGTHGIYLIKGHAHGVLLPQVATEYGWDRETFLRHTCLKAGLPETAWQKDCELFIFSADVFGEEPPTPADPLADPVQPVAVDIVSPLVVGQHVGPGAAVQVVTAVMEPC